MPTKDLTSTLDRYLMALNSNRHLMVLGTKNASTRHTTEIPSYHLGKIFSQTALISAQNRYIILLKLCNFQVVLSKICRQIDWLKAE